VFQHLRRLARQALVFDLACPPAQPFLQLQMEQ
jgi:hypothetical protein